MSIRIEQRLSKALLVSIGVPSNSVHLRRKLHSRVFVVSSRLGRHFRRVVPSAVVRSVLFVTHLQILCFSNQHNSLLQIFCNPKISNLGWQILGPSRFRTRNKQAVFVDVVENAKKYRRNEISNFSTMYCSFIFATTGCMPVFDLRFRHETVKLN